MFAGSRLLLPDLRTFLHMHIYSAAWKFVNPLEFSIFLHKYDPKHHQIFAQVLKVDKENPIKQMRQIFSLPFIYSGKWSNIAYLCIAKVCDSLGLAVNLKVILESSVQRCFESVQWLSNVSSWPVLFKKQGSIKVWSCLWKWIMSWTKEITEDLWKRVDVAHQARKDYKTISKEFGLHKSTVRQIVYKWRKFKTTVTFPRSGRPTKITPKQNV